MRIPSQLNCLTGLLALAIVTGCQSASQQMPPRTPTFESYELTDDPVYAQAAEQHWALIVARCDKSDAAARADCSLRETIRSLPDGEVVRDYCHGEGGYIVVSDCIIKMALTLDLRRLTRDSDPAAILSRMPRDSYPFGPGRAAGGFVKAIWQGCPEDTDAQQCRATEAAARLGLSAGTKAACAQLDQERKFLRCLISHRLADVMGAAAARLGPA